MRQAACNATLDRIGHLHGCRYLLHDRDTKFCPEFRETLAAGGEVFATSSSQTDVGCPFLGRISRRPLIIFNAIMMALCMHVSRQWPIS
jgi:hypothetical protein